MLYDAYGAEGPLAKKVGSSRQRLYMLYVKLVTDECLPIKKGRSIVNFMRNHQWTRSLIRGKSHSKNGSNKELAAEPCSGLY
jgi:hypothetical protein